MMAAKTLLMVEPLPHEEECDGTYVTLDAKQEHMIAFFINAVFMFQTITSGRSRSAASVIKLKVP